MSKIDSPHAFSRPEYDLHFTETEYDLHFTETKYILHVFTLINREVLRL